MQNRPLSLSKGEPLFINQLQNNVPLHTTVNLKCSSKGWKGEHRATPVAYGARRRTQHCTVLELKRTASL